MRVVTHETNTGTWDVCPSCEEQHGVPGGEYYGVKFGLHSGECDHPEHPSRPCYRYDRERGWGVW